MSRISTESYNLRYLLWKEEKIKREKWVDKLIFLLGCSKMRAKQLLLNDLLEQNEKNILAEAFNKSDEDFTVSLFFDDKVNTLLENLNYLFESVMQIHIAKEIGVTERTISRWKAGDHDISDGHLAALRRIFQLPSGTDLRKDPIFLSWVPIDDRGRRQWLSRQIKEIDSADLTELFPAFEKLFK